MRVRAQTVLVQVWLALLCSLGAGLSGDLFSLHTGHSTHTARHSRSTGQRGTRSVGRDGYGDHSLEVEVLDNLTYTTAGHDSAAVILPPVVSFVPEFVQLASASLFEVSGPRAIDLLAPPARAPPALS